MFSNYGNPKLVKDILKLERKKLTKMSAFSLKILEGKEKYKIPLIHILFS